MKIRHAQPQDSSNVSVMHRKLYPSIKEKRLVPLRAEVKSIILVAEEKNELIAYIWGNVIHYGLTRIGYIEELFVQQDFRGKGIGTTLLKSLIRNFKRLKVETFFINAEKENKNAINFYKKIGFHSDDDKWLYWCPRYHNKNRKKVKVMATVHR